MAALERHSDPPADVVVARPVRARVWVSYAAAALAVVILVSALLTGDFSWSMVVLAAYFCALAASTRRSFARVDADGVAWSAGYRTAVLRWEDIAAVHIVSPPRLLTWLGLTTPIFLVPTTGRNRPLAPGNSAGQATRFRASLIAHAQHRGVEVRER